MFIYTLEFKNNNYNNRDSFKNYTWEEIEFKSNKNLLNFFSNNENFYNKNGIPYTLGILLEGKPGTGRIDLHIKMQSINFNILNQMYYYYFNNLINEDKIDECIKNINEYNITPAEITNLLVNSDDEINFIELLQTTINEKKN